MAARWDAVDVASDPDVLAARGYTDCINFDVEGERVLRSHDDMTR
jgi:hypothetical protein